MHIYIYILLAFSCFFSFLSFISVLFLSNALYRQFNKKDIVTSEKKQENEEKGLVDINSVGTYDPRFSR